MKMFILEKKINKNININTNTEKNLNTLWTIIQLYIFEMVWENV